MECAVCQTRSAVGYCAQCKTMLCEVCGVACAACGSITCKRHSAKDAAGRSLCSQCQTHQNSPAQPPPQPAVPAKQTAPKPEVLTFDALAEELGRTEWQGGGGPESDASQEARSSAPDDTQRKPAQDKPARSAAQQTAPQRKKLVMDMDEDAINARVLTGSAPKGTPVWLSGAFLGVVACVTTWLLRGFIADPRFQRIGSGLVIVIALGAILWSGSGLFNQNASSRDRKLCIIGIVLGLAAALAGTLLRP